MIIKSTHIVKLMIYISRTVLKLQIQIIIEPNQPWSRDLLKILNTRRLPRRGWKEVIYLGNHESVEKDIGVSVREQLAAVDQIDRTYFGKDRQRILKTMIDEVISLLDTKPIEFVQNKKEKADLLFLRGKILDYLPEYSKGAEDFLSKSIKLMPSKFEAWDALGHVYWKKRDLSGAKKCFEGSLEQNENNKDALRHLSMVLRMSEEPNAETKKKNYQLSI